MIWSLWWVWIAGAIVLGILEMLAPAFVLLGFAVGAAFVGVGLGIGLLSGVSFPALLVIFAALSLLAWIGLRFAFRVKGDAAKTFDYDVND
jgi:membrane protein implicated in regulation of membrane protease activity